MILGFTYSANQFEVRFAARLASELPSFRFAVSGVRKAPVGCPPNLEIGFFDRVTYTNYMRGRGWPRSRFCSRRAFRPRYPRHWRTASRYWRRLWPWRSFRASGRGERCRRGRSAEVCGIISTCWRMGVLRRICPLGRAPITLLPPQPGGSRWGAWRVLEQWGWSIAV